MEGTHEPHLGDLFGSQAIQLILLLKRTNKVGHLIEKQQGEQEE
jgi:hypothetical protein